MREHCFISLVIMSNSLVLNIYNKVMSVGRGCWERLPVYLTLFKKKICGFGCSELQATPKPNTFMPFGSGVHSCPGNELAKLEILIFMHHVVTKFRYIILLHQIQFKSPGVQSMLESDKSSSTSFCWHLEEFLFLFGFIYRW